jgi:hypothetical protein
MQSNDSELKNDILWGATAIALQIGRTDRQTYYMLEKGELPARKVCGTWVASKTKLRTHLSGEQS